MIIRSFYTLLLTILIFQASIFLFSSPSPLSKKNNTPVQESTSDTKEQTKKTEKKEVAGIKITTLIPSNIPVFNSVSTSIDSTSSNLIRNSSFETESSGQPRGWYYLLDSTTGNTFISPEGIRSGNFGLKFVGTAPGNFGIMQPDLKTVPGRTYTLSAYIKQVNTPPITFRLGLWNEYLNKEGPVKNLSLSTGTKDWTRVSFTTATPGLITDPKNMFPILEVFGLSSGSVYIDDIQLEEGSSPSVYNSAQAKPSAISGVGDGSIIFSPGGDIYPNYSGLGSLGSSTNKFQSLTLSNAKIDKDGNLTVNGSEIKGALTLNGNLSLKSGAVITLPSLSGGILHSDSSGSISASSVNLANSDVTGTLPVGNGGTGATSLTQYGVLYGNGTNSISALTPGTTGQILQSNGASGAPSWVAPTGLAADNIAFSGITNGTNTSAAMIIGAGASLTYSGGAASSGVINVNQLLGNTWTSPGSIGITTPNSGSFTTLSASSLDVNGNLLVQGGGTIDTRSSGTLAIGNTTATTITLGRSGQGITIPGFDCSAQTNGGALTTTSGGVLTCSADDSGGGSGSSNWRLTNGALSPINDTLDLLLGNSATSSAKFAFINVAGGTPTASISANSGNNALFIDGLGNIQTTNRQTLILGNSASNANSTGNILLNPNGTGNIGIGTTTPGAKLTVQSGTEYLNILPDSPTNYVTLYAPASHLRMRSGGDMDMKIFSSTDKFTFYHQAGTDSEADDASLVTILGTGSVGIGTTGPSAKLNVIGDILASTTIGTGTYTQAGLPAAGTAGRIASLSDTNRSLVRDTGTQWVPVNGNVYNVKDFGAKGDNSTDDTAAIQTAIDAAASGDVVFLPSGYYRFTSLTINKYIHLKGNGYSNSMLIPTSNVDAINLNVGSGSIVYNIMMSDLAIYPVTNRTAGAALRLGYIGYATFNNIKIGNSLGGQPYEGVRIDRASNTRFQNLIVTGTASHGVVMQPQGTDNIIVDVQFDAMSDISANGGSGFYLTNTYGGTASLEGIYFNGTTVYNNADSGIRMNAAGGTISNIFINKAILDWNLGTTGGGLYVEGNSAIANLIVQDTWSSYNSGYGVYLNSNVTDFQIENGFILTNMKDGVYINGATRGIFNGNSIFNNSREASSSIYYGINIGGSASQIDILNNKIYNTTRWANYQHGISIGSSASNIQVRDNFLDVNAGIGAISRVPLVNNGSKVRLSGNTVDSTNSNTYLDIGSTTSTPSALMNVSGRVTGKALAVFNETGDQAIFTASSSGVTKFVIDNSGNVGIGTTGGLGKLNIIQNGVYSVETAPGIRIDSTSTSPDTTLMAGVDATNHVAFIQSFQSYASWTNRPLALQPNGGNVGIGTTSPLAKLDVRGAGSATLPIASLSGSTNFAGLVVDNSGSGDLFTASSSGLNRFVITQSGNIGIGKSIPTSTLDVSGTLAVSGTSVFSGLATFNAGASIASGQNLTLAGITGNNAVLYATSGTGATAGTTTNTANLCLVSGASSPSWQSCALGAGTNFWDSSSGALYPNNSTLDLLIGGTATTSAKFAFLNVAGGTPTASISANSGNNALYLTGDGTLATTNKATLTIGNSSTYNSTGNILLNPNGTGSVGIGTTAPLAKLDVNGNLRATGFHADTPTATTSNAGLMSTSDKTKVSRWIDAKADYSINCDGTDETAKFQTLISSLTSGTTVVFPAGTCGYSSELTIGNGTNSSQGTIHNILLLGQGGSYYFSSGTIFKWLGGTSSGTMLTLAGNADQLSIKGITFDANNAIANGVTVYSDHYGSLEDIGILNFTNTGLSLLTRVGSLPSHWTNYLTVKGFYIISQNNGITGLLVDGDYAGNADNWQNSFRDGIIQVPNASSGTNYAAHFKFTDSSLFENVELNTYGAGNGYAAWFDGTDNANYPQNLSFLNSSVNSTKVTGTIGKNQFYGFKTRDNETIPTDSNLIGYTDTGQTFNGGISIFQGAVVGKALMSLNETGDQAIFTASASGATKFIIKNDGTVGVGTTNPGSSIDAVATYPMIRSTGYSGFGIIGARAAQGTEASPTQLTSGNALGYFAFYGYNNGGWAGSTTATMYATAAENFTSSSNMGTNLMFATTPIGSGSRAERMRIDSQGSVGINTTTASLSAIFEVRGVGINTLSGTIPVASISGQTSFAAMVVDNKGVGDLFTASSSGLNRFVITQNGNVGIGTTSPKNLLDINGAINAPKIYSGSAATAFGDSITVGVGASSGSKNYVSLIGNETGWTMSNAGVSGSEMGDTAYSILLASSSASTSRSIFLSGYNDMRHYGNSTTGQTTFADAYRAALVWMAIPDSQKIIANNASVTKTGTWSTEANYNGFNGLGSSAYSSTINDTATVTLYGTAVYVGFTYRTNLGSGGTFEVLVDGVSYGITDEMAGVSPVSALSYWPGLIRIGGLTPGPHEVTVKVKSAAKTNIDWFASNDQLPGSTGPFVYAGGTLRMNAAGYAGASPWNNGSNAVAEQFNQIERQITSQLVADGLKVVYVDVNKYYNANTSDMGPDNSHPSDQGYSRISNAFLDSINNLSNPLEKGGSLYAAQLANYLQVYNGSIGINTASPLAKLDIRGAATATSPIASFSGSTTFAGMVVDNSGSGDLFTASSSGLSRFVITQNGSIGIGTAAPAATVDIIGAGVNLTGTAYYNFLNRQDNSTGRGIFAGYDTSGQIGVIGATGPSSNLAFYTHNGSAWNERLRITSSGNIGIGTTSPLAKLDVRGAATATSPIASFSGSTTFAGIIVDNNGTGDLFTASKSGAKKFTIFNNGNIEIVGTAGTCTIGNGTSATNCSSSDMRLKDNITPLSKIKGIDAVRLLNPVSFKWNSWMQSNDATSNDQFGFIAQDVAKIFPNLVEQDKNTGYYKLDYQGFFAPLVKSIQELDVEVNNSGDLISSLALRIDALEQQATASASASQSAALANDVNSQLSTLQSQVNSLSAEALAKADQFSSLQSQIASLSGSLMPISPIPSLATSGAQLTLDAIDIKDATISGTLSVTGRTLLSDVGITGTINAGNLAINGLDNNGFASINTNAGALRLQSHGLYGLDILDGKVTIAENGDIKTQGNITAKEVAAETFKVLGSKSAGNAVLPAGQTEVEITAVIATNSAKILLTPTTLTDKILTIIEKGLGKFKVGIVSPTSSDIKFDWFIIQ